MESIPEEFSDCARDVLAMTEAMLLVQTGTSAEEILRWLEDYRVLAGHADLAGCLEIAVLLVAASWTSASESLAKANGTSEAVEFSRIVARFREKLAALG